jgi:hypothetical protein
MPDKTSRKARKGARTTASLAEPRDTEAAKTDQYIADQLKAIYDAVVVEPIPDRLMRLLDRLDDNDEEK